MSVLYSVSPLNLCMSDPATVDWLVGLGVKLPDQPPPGRFPSPAEIRAVLDAVPGIRTHYQVTASVWQVTITSRRDVPWASLVIRDYDGHPHDPHPFYFDAGWDEIITQVVFYLVKICGPLVLLDDSGSPPKLIMY